MLLPMNAYVYHSTYFIVRGSTGPMEVGFETAFVSIVADFCDAIPRFFQRNDVTIVLHAYLQQYSESC